MKIISFFNKILTVLLLAGATLMLLFIVFSGSVDNFPFNKFFWVEADVSSLSVPGGDYARWTFWGICYPDELDSASTSNCPHLGPDVPISPYDNFGNSANLPQDFVDNSSTYYYLSRFSFPFLLIALIFSGVSLISSIMAPCWLAMQKVIVFFVGLGCLFCTTGACLITSVAVLTRNHFRDADMASKIGATSLGLVWASTACLMIVFLTSCCSATRKVYNKEQQQFQHNVSTQAPVQYPPTGLPQNDELNQFPQQESSGIRFFKIRRNQEKADGDSVV